MYKLVVDPSKDETLEARVQTTVWRNGERTQTTIYVPKGTPEYKIPARLELDPAKIAEAQESHQWILERFGR